MITQRVKEEIKEWAYTMEHCYREEVTREDCINKTKKLHPDADEKVLYGMWMAIDAYVDMERDKFFDSLGIEE